MDSQMTIIIKFDGHQNVMVVIITANDTDFRKSDKGDGCNSFSTNNFEMHLI